MAETSLVGEQIASDGSVAGVRARADVFIDKFHGVVFQDDNGVLYKLYVDTTGTLNTQVITI